MIVVPPIAIAGAVLVSTNAVDAAAWSNATTYAVDAVVSKDLRNWRSLQAGNLSKTPGSEPLWWVDDGPVNSRAAFDTSVNTATTRVGGLTFVLAPGRFGAIGFDGLIGNSITVTVRDGLAGPVIFTETRSLAASLGTYHSFCFDELIQQRQTVFLGVPSTVDAHITVTIAATGTAACGLCVVGKQVFIGIAMFGFGLPIEDRGRHYLDTLGNPVNLERGYSKGLQVTLDNNRAAYNRLVNFFADHVAETMLWVTVPSQNDLVSAIVFGRYVRAVPVLQNKVQVITALEIAGSR